MPKTPEKKIYGYAITDSTGMIHSYEDGDEIVFYRTQSAAKRGEREAIDLYGYRVVKIEIKKVSSNETPTPEA